MQTLIRFTRRFEYTPSDNRYVTISYPQGYEGEVDQACADLALASGAGVEVDDEFGDFIERLSDPDIDDDLDGEEVE
jgi:hypothetical protein